MCIHILYLYTVNSSSSATSPYITHLATRDRASLRSLVSWQECRGTCVAFIRENTVCRTIDDTRGGLLYEGKEGEKEGERGRERKRKK